MNSVSAATSNVATLSVELTTTYLPVNLAEHVDNRAISPAGDTAAGAFNVWGNSFPAEHLPPPGALVRAHGVPFRLAPAHPRGDNVRCAGQFVAVPAAEYDWLHLLVAAERRTEDTVALHF